MPYRLNDTKSSIEVECIECEPSYVLKNGQSGNLSTCEDVTDYDSCEIVRAYDTECIECKSGYYQDGYQCVSSIDNCNFGYHKDGQSICIECV